MSTYYTDHEITRANRKYKREQRYKYTYNKKNNISVRLNEEIIIELKKIANFRDMSYSSMVRSFVIEKLMEEQNIFDYIHNQNTPIQNTQKIHNEFNEKKYNNNRIYENINHNKNIIISNIKKNTHTFMKENNKIFNLMETTFKKDFIVKSFTDNIIKLTIDYINNINIESNILLKQFNMNNQPENSN